MHKHFIFDFCNLFYILACILEMRIGQVGPFDWECHILLSKCSFFLQAFYILFEKLTDDFLQIFQNFLEKNFKISIRLLYFNIKIFVNIQNLNHPYEKFTFIITNWKFFRMYFLNFVKFLPFLLNFLNFWENFRKNLLKFQENFREWMLQNF